MHNPQDGVPAPTPPVAGAVGEGSSPETHADTSELTERVAVVLFEIEGGGHWPDSNKPGYLRMARAVVSEFLEPLQAENKRLRTTAPFLAGMQQAEYDVKHWSESWMSAVRRAEREEARADTAEEERDAERRVRNALKQERDALQAELGRVKGEKDRLVKTAVDYQENRDKALADAKLAAGIAKMWHEKWTAAEERLDSLREALLSDEAVEAAGVAVGMNVTFARRALRAALKAIDDPELAADRQDDAGGDQGSPEASASRAASLPPSGSPPTTPASLVLECSSCAARLHVDSPVQPVSGFQPLSAEEARAELERTAPSRFDDLDLIAEQQASELYDAGLVLARPVPEEEQK